MTTDRLSEIKARQEFRNARQSWTAGEEQDRQDAEWLLGRSEELKKALVALIERLPESSLPIAPGRALAEPSYTSFDGKRYCVFCRGGLLNSFFDHAAGCPIKVGKE